MPEAEWDKNLRVWLIPQHSSELFINQLENSNHEFNIVTKKDAIKKLKKSTEDNMKTYFNVNQRKIFASKNKLTKVFLSSIIFIIKIQA